MENDPAPVSYAIDTRHVTGWRTYLELTKPRIWALLVFTSFATMLLASRQLGNPLTLELVALGIISITLGCAGCEAITGYLERDIDKAMVRTKERPVPSGRISPASKALYFGIILLILSTIMAAFINLLSLALLVLGIVDNIFIYTILSKRRSAWNIILGSFSGAVPAVFGWTVISGTLSLLPVLVGLLVILWTPWHIWSLAYYFRDDYKNAGIPMLPVVVKNGTTIMALITTALLMFVFSLTIYFAGLGLPYLAIAMISGGFVVAGNMKLIKNPSPSYAWKMFKVSGPYLLIIFIGIMVDALI